MSRITKALSETLQPRAQCLACDWMHGPHRSTRDEAKWHVRSTGHPVRVVTEIHDLYQQVGQ